MVPKFKENLNIISLNKNILTIIYQIFILNSLFINLTTNY